MNNKEGQENRLTGRILITGKKIDFSKLVFKEKDKDGFTPLGVYPVRIGLLTRIKWFLRVQDIAFLLRRLFS